MTERRLGNELTLALISRAILAPSSHNTQPWLFRISDSGIDLLADRARALPVNDPLDRELTISCGCALLNLRIAAAQAGLQVQVEPLPDPAQPALLARVTLTPASGPPDREAVLHEFIARRRTYRQPFTSRRVEAAAADLLTEAAAVEGAWLRPLFGADQRQQAARLVAEGDAVQWANTNWRRELAAWMRPRRYGDGLTVPALGASLARLVIRTFNMGGRVGQNDLRLTEVSPLLALLGTEGDSPGDWLRAGQALQRVLLVGCQHGLQAAYLNQPIQVAALRPRLSELVGAGFAQILLRLGYPASVVPPAPRRPIQDVLE